MSVLYYCNKIAFGNLWFNSKYKLSATHMPKTIQELNNVGFFWCCSCIYLLLWGQNIYIKKSFFHSTLFVFVYFVKIK